jgi:uncharacterized membrane protein HdeD (DUF308 family)
MRRRRRFGREEAGLIFWAVGCALVALSPVWILFLPGVAPGIAMVIVGLPMAIAGIVLIPSSRRGRRARAGRAHTWRGRRLG